MILKDLVMERCGKNSIVFQAVGAQTKQGVAVADEGFFFAGDGETR